MPTRNVVLTDAQHWTVESLVRSGRYRNASEVLRDGLRLIERREAEDQIRLKALRNAANVGWSDVAANRCTDVAEDDLIDYMGELGARVSERVRAAS